MFDKSTKNQKPENLPHISGFRLTSQKVMKKIKTRDAFQDLILDNILSQLHEHR